MGRRREVRVLDRPPYVTPPSTQQKLELDRLADGIEYRAIYGTEVFESEDIMGVLPELQAAGEVGRVLAQVPMKMAVGDDDTALIGLTKRAPAESNLLIRSSGLLDGLIATFEMLWALAIPMPALLGERRGAGAAVSGSGHPAVARRWGDRRHDQPAPEDQPSDDPASGPRADGGTRRADPVPGGRSGRPPPLDLTVRV